MIKPKRHTSLLVPSDQDMVTLCATTVENYNRLLKTYRRVKGIDLVIPNDLESARVLVAGQFSRYEVGDFRHNESEKRALRQFAQWTLIVNADIRGQEGDVELIEWGD